MTPLQVVVLGLVAVGGTAVVLVRDPLRQAMVVGVYGLTLAVLFVVFQAPDVALSLGAVGSVALPLMIVMSLAKTRSRDPEE
jgi:energy-converting hydrogenase B subunit D